MQKWAKVSLNQMLQVTKKELYIMRRNSAIRFIPVFVIYSLLSISLLKLAQYMLT